MVHLPMPWPHTPGLHSPMQNSSADNLPSLSATCPTITNDPLERLTLSGYHDATKPFHSFSDAQVKPAKKPITSKTHEVAVRAAKKEISMKVREDWTWPLTTPDMDAPLTELGDANAWRERQSDSEYSPSSVLKADPYRFDNPDSIAQPVLSKKRKRRQLLKDELAWNDGLRTYIERRDAWAGARIQTLTPSHVPPHLSTPYSTSQKSAPKPCSLRAPPSPTNPETIPSTQPPSSPPPSPRTLLPVAPPILPPDNPIRASISPATYPSIYEKIIIRGLSPTVPINLKDVVHALVAGWKKDGEWPPKSEAEKGGGGQVDGGAEGEQVGKRLARRGVGRVKRVLGLGRGVDDEGGGE